MSKTFEQTKHEELFTGRVVRESMMIDNLGDGNAKITTITTYDIGRPDPIVPIPGIENLGDSIDDCVKLIEMCFKEVGPLTIQGVYNWSGITLDKLSVCLGDPKFDLLSEEKGIWGLKGQDLPKERIPKPAMELVWFIRSIGIVDVNTIRKKGKDFGLSTKTVNLYLNRFDVFECTNLKIEKPASSNQFSYWKINEDNLKGYHK